MISRDPETEKLAPAPDGATTSFDFSFVYKDGTVSVWVNGRRKIQSYEDGFSELGGTAVRLKEAPLAGDTVQGRAERA